MKQRAGSATLWVAVGLAVAALAPMSQAAEPGKPGPPERLAAPPVPSVARSIPVVGYGAGLVSRADLKGTDLAPAAGGSIKASAKGGAVRLSLSVANLPEATSFGPEFLTYVAWAVTTDGQVKNLGEVRVSKGKGKLETTTQAQVFGLAVTAEPYFAAGAPSELVVLQNAFTGKGADATIPSEVRFLAFPRATYSGEGVEPPDPAAVAPLDIHQARNAVRIAKAFGADRYASDSVNRASQALLAAEAFLQDKKNQKLASPKAREAVQSAESARALAVQKIEEARVADEKAKAGLRAEEATLAAEQARAEATAAKREAETAQAEAAAANEKAVAAQEEAAEEARRRAAAEEEKHALREKLLKQFNLILETRDSARGLIVNLGDVLFDLNKYTLRPEAREKLAKLSGVVLGNPGLKLAVEGHTDSTGSDEHNQTLSENRAGAVRDYLVGQNVPAEAITATGFGKTRPVATNDTAEGRKKNRRVEIVVSGDIIGVEADK